MNKLFLIIVLALFIIGCPKGPASEDVTTQDSTTIVLDTIPGDTTGADSILIND